MDHTRLSGAPPLGRNTLLVCSIFPSVINNNSKAAVSHILSCRELLDFYLWFHNSCLFIFIAIIFPRSLYQPALPYVPFNVCDQLYGDGARIPFERRFHRAGPQMSRACLGRERSRQGCDTDRREDSQAPTALKHATRNVKVAKVPITVR